MINNRNTNQKISLATRCSHIFRPVNKSVDVVHFCTKCCLKLNLLELGGIRMGHPRLQQDFEGVIRVWWLSV